MLHISTLNQAKKSARALERALAQKGLALSHGQALDVLSVMCGHQDWNSFSQSRTPQALAATLVDFERAHLEQCQALDYGDEAVLVAHTGFQLRCNPAESAPCDYVRVCDPLGRELMFWSSTEWAEDPEAVMGAVIGALVRGTGISSPAAPARKATPRIQDVDFFDAHLVIIGDVHHEIVWREEAVLALLDPALKEDQQDRGDCTALSLTTYDAHGFTVDTAITLEELLSLTWDEEVGNFVNPEGVVYQFRFSVAAESWFERKV